MIGVLGIDKNLTYSPYSLEGGKEYLTLAPGFINITGRGKIQPNGLGCPTPRVVGGVGDLETVLASFGGSAVGGVIFAVGAYLLINNFFSADAKKARGKKRIDSLTRKYNYDLAKTKAKYGLSRTFEE